MGLHLLDWIRVFNSLFWFIYISLTVLRENDESNTALQGFFNIGFCLEFCTEQDGSLVDESNTALQGCFNIGFCLEFCTEQDGSLVDESNTALKGFFNI